MKKYFTIALATILATSIVSSCAKKDMNSDKCSSVIFAKNENQINALTEYIQNNQINAQLHTDGFYYEIIKEGEGKAINTCSNVTVKYTGKLTNNNIFDGSDNMSFSLEGLIPGWRLGLPLVKSGGHILLYIPAYLAYGSQGVGNTIPGNAITIFDIEVINAN